MASGKELGDQTAKQIKTRTLCFFKKKKKKIKFLAWYAYMSLRRDSNASTAPKTSKRYASAARCACLLILPSATGQRATVPLPGKAQSHSPHPSKFLMTL